MTALLRILVSDVRQPAPTSLEGAGRDRHAVQARECLAEDLRLAILRIEESPAEERARPGTVHGRDQVGKEVVQGLGAGDDPRLVVDDPKLLNQAVEHLRHLGDLQ
jgi:hypothetical protein